MKRKEFLKVCSLACIGGTGLMAFLQSCAATSYVLQASIIDNRLVIRRSEFTVLKDGQTEFRNYLLAKNPRLQFPIYIYRHNENEFTALYMQCTHKGCELQANGDYLTCPCHGSEFTNRGLVSHPPAEINLRQFEVTTDNENIYVRI